MAAVDKVEVFAQQVFQASTDSTAQETPPPAGILQAQSNRFPVVGFDLLGKAALPVIQALLLCQLELLQHIHAIHSAAAEQSSLLVGIAADVVV